MSAPRMKLPVMLKALRDQGFTVSRSTDGYRVLPKDKAHAVVNLHPSVFKADHNGYRGYDDLYERLRKAGFEPGKVATDRKSVQLAGELEVTEYVVANPGTAPLDIATALAMPSGTLSQTIDRLAARGVLKRTGKTRTRAVRVWPAGAMTATATVSTTGDPHTPPQPGGRMRITATTLPEGRMSATGTPTATPVRVVKAPEPTFEQAWTIVAAEVTAMREAVVTLRQERDEAVAKLANIEARLEAVIGEL